MRTYLLIMLALAATTRIADAQSIWLGGGANGNWSTSSNWNSAPVSSASSALTFSGTAQTNTVMNIGTTFVLNSLTVTNDATNGFVVSGGTLQFAGSSANVSFNGGSGVYLIINSAIDLSVAGVSFIDNANSTSLIYEINLRGALSGSNNLTHSGGTARELMVSGKNNNLTGMVTQSGGGVLWLANHNALGRGASVNITGGTFASSPDASEATTGVVGGIGYHQQHAQLAGTSGNFQLGGIAASTSAFGFNGIGTNLASGILGTNVGNHLAKVGNGITNYTGTGAYAGNLSVRDGTLNIQGTNGVTGGFSNNSSAGIYTFYAGSTLSQTITGGTGTSDRIGNLTVIALAGGSLVHASSTTTTGGFDSTVGSLSLNAGQSTIRISTSNSTGTSFSFSNGMTLNTTTGTLLVQGNNLGTGALNSVSATNVSVSGATGPNAGLFVGTTTVYSLTTPDMRILPFGFVGTTTLGDPSTLLTYDASNQSLRGLVDTNYSNSFTVNPNNVSLSVVTTLSGGATANSLRMQSGCSLNLAGNTLTLNSGALLNNGGGNITNGIINFGPTNNLTAYLTTNGNWLIDATINASNLSKNGAGNLTLNASVVLGTNGVVAINAGTLTLAGAASFTNAGTYQIARDASLDATSSGLSLVTGQLLHGSGTVAGTLTVNGGATVRPSALGGSGADLASPGILNVGNTTLQPNGSYEWLISSVIGGQYTQSMLQGASGSTLNLTNLNSSNRFNLRVRSLSLANSDGAVYDNDVGAAYTWQIANFPGGITGFSADKFNVDMTGATWGANAPNLTVSSDGTSLYLTTSVVPEPSHMLLLAAGLFALAYCHRRVRFQHYPFASYASQE